MKKMTTKQLNRVKGYIMLATLGVSMAAPVMNGPKALAASETATAPAK
ncbi:hypothetical protein [Periweissella cryptocerci]|nr:hypothetical protein [Periweissella cryptocerci]